MIKITTKGNKSPGLITGDFVDKSTNITIKNGLSIFGQFRQVFHKISAPLKHYYDNPKIDFADLADNYFLNNLSVGQQITVEGFLSKYLLTHRSDFHIPYTQSAGETIISEPIASAGNVKMQINSNVTQLPVQSFPYSLIDNKKKYIYFLYPSDFESFILDVCPEKKRKIEKKEFVETVLNIDRKAQPIVLISPKDITQSTERIVKVTGILNSFDTQTASVFTSRLSNTQTDILQNSFRPYNESMQTLCIDLSIEPLKCKMSELKIIDSLPATIYAETHFENTERIKNYNNFIGDMLPNAYPGLHWTSFNSNNHKISCGLCDSNVSIITRKFREFAYYIDTDLINPDVYREKLNNLRDFIDIFRTNTRRFYKKYTGVEIVNIYDFIFDYTKAAYFHPKGIMSSKKSNEIAEEGDNYDQTITWLKSNI